jgi:hypothetical protein
LGGVFNKRYFFAIYIVYPDINKHESKFEAGFGKPGADPDFLRDHYTNAAGAHRLTEAGELAGEGGPRHRLTPGRRYAVLQPLEQDAPRIST